MNTGNSDKKKHAKKRQHELERTHVRKVIHAAESGNKSFTKRSDKPPEAPPAPRKTILDRISDMSLGKHA